MRTIVDNEFAKVFDVIPSEHSHIRSLLGCQFSKKRYEGVIIPSIIKIRSNPLRIEVEVLVPKPRKCDKESVIYKLEKKTFDLQDMLKVNSLIKDIVKLDENVTIPPHQFIWNVLRNIGVKT